MSKNEIQKLIGGYATGSLTEEERRQLFDAALEDQELFDALQGEQALKALLDDPATREAVRAAAASDYRPPLNADERRWFRRAWVWASGAAVVAAAAVLLVVMIQLGRQPAAVTRVAVVHKELSPAPMTPPAQPAASAPAVRRLPAKKQAPVAPAEAVPEPPVAVAENTAPPAPSPAAPPASAGRLDSQQQVVGGHQQNFAPALQNQVQSTGTATVFRPQMAKSARAATVTSQLALQAPQVFRFARRMEDGSYQDLPGDTVFHAGETIRVTFIPRASGPVVLAEWDAQRSSWNQIFPAAGETVQVTAREPYTIPFDIVLKSGERLRVTVDSLPAEMSILIR